MTAKHLTDREVELSVRGSVATARALPCPHICSALMRCISKTQVRQSKGSTT